MANDVRVGSGSVLLIPDASKFRSMSERDLKKIRLMHQVTLTPVMSQTYRQDAKARLDKLNLRHSVTLHPTLNTGFRSDAKTKIDASLRSLSHTVTLNLNVSTAMATAQMLAWRKREEANPVRVKVITDRVGGARSAPAAAPRESALPRHLESQFTGRQGSGLMLPVNMDLRGAESQLQDFDRKHFSGRGTGDKFKIRPSIDPKSDLNNDPAWRSKMRKASYEWNDAFRLRIQPNLAGMQLRLPMGALGLSAIPAMVSQLGGLTAGLVQLSQAALVLPGAFAMAGASIGTFAVGISGLKEAWKALGDQEKHSTETASQQRMEQRQMTDAVADETRARRDLSNAVEQEQRRQRDLALQLRGAKLSEAEAILEVQDAEAEVRQGHFSGERERDHALIRFEQSKQNLLEVRNRNADLAQDVAKNEHTGVRGSDSVVSATQALTKATERVAEATQKLGEGSTSMQQAAEKSKAALDKLSPSGRQFIQTLFDMKPAFREFANSVQEPLTKDLGPAFARMFNSPSIQQNLRSGMQGLAGSMNRVMQTEMATISTPESGGLITRLFAGSTDAMSRLSDQVVKPLTTGILQLSAAGSEAMPRIISGMGELATRFANFISKADADGSLKTWIDQGIDAMTTFGRIVYNIGDSLTGISKAFGTEFLTSVEKVTKQIADFLNSAKGQSELKNFIVETKLAMDEWKPILKDLPTILHAAFEAGRTAVQEFLPIVQAFTWVLKECPGLIGTVATAFVAWKTINPIMTGLSGLMNGFANQVTNVGTRFGGARAEAKNAAKDIDEAFKAAGGGGGGMQKLATKASTLATAFSAGGPLVTALTFGAMLALDNWMQKEEDAAQTTQSLINLTNELAQTLDRTTGMATEQTRQKIAEAYADFHPRGEKQGALGGNVLAAASAIGVGGEKGQELVTAAMPAGGKLYDEYMKKIRDMVRPTVLEMLNKRGLSGQSMADMGISEDDAIDAYLGVPAALDKIRGAKLAGVPVDFDLGKIASMVKARGGQALDASLVGQALNEQRFGTGSAGTRFGAAAGAARPNVGLNQPTAGAFGPKASAKAGDGQFKIVSDQDPASPGMKAIMEESKGSITASENPPGVTDYKSWTYVLSRDQARKYMTGVPEYGEGGMTDGDGLAMLHSPEFVVSEKGTRKYPLPFLEDVNQGKFDLDSVPHYKGGGIHDILGAITGGIPKTVTGDNSGGGKTVDGDTTGGGDVPSITDIPNGVGRVGLSNDGPLGILGKIFGLSGSGGGGSAPDLGGIAEKFGQIMMSGVLGFFGINPQYFNDAMKIANFGLGKLGGGYSDPDAKEAVEGKIMAYDKDGNPIGYMDSSGTPLPDANSGGDDADAGDTPSPAWGGDAGKNAGAPKPAAAAPGVGSAAGAAAVNAAPGAGAAVGVMAPGGRTIGANPLSKANFGGTSPPTVTPELLKSRGINPIYNWATGSDPKPKWAQDLATQFGVTLNTDPHGQLHTGGYAWDFNAMPGDKDGQAKLDKLAEFIDTNLAGQTLQLIRQSPTSGKKWGIAAGTRVGNPGTANPGYYSGDFGGHTDHVHWATDVPVLFDGAPELAPHAGAWGSKGSKAAPSGMSNFALGNIGGLLSSIRQQSRPTITAPSNGPLGSAPAAPSSTQASKFGAMDTAELLKQLLSRDGRVAAVVSGQDPRFTNPQSGRRGGANRRKLPPAGVPKDLTGFKKMAYQMYIQSGMPANEWGDFDALIDHESSWSPTAQNPGSTAHGLGQFLDSTWASVGGSKTDDPMLQLQYIFSYLKQRKDYGGSPARAWKMWQERSPHWYGLGGPLEPGLNQVLVEPNAREIVVNEAQQQRIASALAAQATPADPGRSGVNIPPEIISAIPKQAQHMEQPPSQTGGPGPLPSAPAAAAGPSIGGPPSEPEQVKTADGVAPSTAGDATQPDVAPAPKSTDHLLPAVRQGIMSAADTIGAWAATAASMGMAAGGGGGGGGAAGMMIQGGVKQAGKIIAGIANVGASALVGNITPGTSDNPYGITQEGEKASPLIGSAGDYSTHYHGDMYTQNMDEFFRRQEIRDAQNMQSQLNAKPGYY